MPGSSFGVCFRLSTWGESHGEAVGVVVEGCPAGLPLEVVDVQRELNRRRVGQSKVTSPRQEADRVHILSGVFGGVTMGTPISMVVYNEDADSSKYEPIRDVFRPGHADFGYFAKYGVRDYRGGGRSSARETVGRVAGGAVARKLLSTRGIRIVGHTRMIGGIEAETFVESEIENNLVRCADPKAAEAMVALIVKSREEKDSVGGIVEVRVFGLPPGLGEPVFDKLDADIAKGLMSIGAIKGVEFGDGFRAAGMRGSEHNDQYRVENGVVTPITNHGGGVTGGLSSGAELVVRAAVKPTSSIEREQQTVDEAGAQRTIEIKGRHDPCICPRIVPIAESMVALVVADHLLRNLASRMESVP